MSGINRYIPSSSHGGTIRVEGCGDGTYIADADHAAEIARLRAEADQNRLDAERWRFVASASSSVTFRLHNTRPDHRERAIDAAMGADA